MAAAFPVRLGKPLPWAGALLSASCGLVTFTDPFYASPASGPTAWMTFVNTTDSTFVKVYVFKDAAGCRGRSWLELPAASERSVVIPAAGTFAFAFAWESQAQYISCRIPSSFPVSDGHAYRAAYVEWPGECELLLTDITTGKGVPYTALDWTTAWGPSGSWCQARSSKGDDVPSRDGAAPLPERVFPLPPAETAPTSRPIEAIEREVRMLNHALGPHPPNFEDEKHRDQIYRTWAQALVDARAVSGRTGANEQTLELLSELYRQGNNLGVTGAFDLAEATVEKCLARFPGNRGCHGSAFGLYLSGDPKYLPRARKSLDALRSAFAPQVIENLEANYVLLYIAQGDNTKASTQIDYFLEKFPQSRQGRAFRVLKERLAQGLR
jgi:hypothetical protein